VIEIQHESGKDKMTIARYSFNKINHDIFYKRSSNLYSMEASLNLIQNKVSEGAPTSSPSNRMILFRDLEMRSFDQQLHNRKLTDRSLESAPKFNNLPRKNTQSNYSGGGGAADKSVNDSQNNINLEQNDQNQENSISEGEEEERRDKVSSKVMTTTYGNSPKNKGKLSPN
jgi:hypothetical protein